MFWMMFLINSKIWLSPKVLIVPLLVCLPIVHFLQLSSECEFQIVGSWSVLWLFLDDAFCAVTQCLRTLASSSVSKVSLLQHVCWDSQNSHKGVRASCIVRSSHAVWITWILQQDRFCFSSFRVWMRTVLHQMVLIAVLDLLEFHFPILVGSVGFMWPISSEIHNHGNLVSIQQVGHAICGFQSVPWHVVMAGLASCYCLHCLCSITGQLGSLSGLCVTGSYSMPWESWSQYWVSQA